MRRQLLLALLVSLISACAMFRPEPSWPAGAYPRSYFVAAFEEDEMAQEYQTLDNYLLWITRFYNGYSIAPGWLNLTEQVLARLEEPQRSEVEERLYHLGGRIGSEWAKDNEVRLLDTGNAATWRDALIEALNQNDLDDYMDRVEEDVERLLAGELDSDDIYFERYYFDEFD